MSKMKFSYQWKQSRMVAGVSVPINHDGSADYDELLREAVQRFHEPDGYCLHCRRPANQHHPIGPITITISTPDEDETHEFCNWDASASGPLAVPVACSSLGGTDPSEPALVGQCFD